MISGATTWNRCLTRSTTKGAFTFGCTSRSTNRSSNWSRHGRDSRDLPVEISGHGVRIHQRTRNRPKTRKRESRRGFALLGAQRTVKPPPRHSASPRAAPGPPTGWSAAVSAAGQDGNEVPASLALGVAVGAVRNGGHGDCRGPWHQAREEHGRSPGCRSLIRCGFAESE